MWERSGFALTKSLKDADIVNFLGGADVSPDLYGEKKLTVTHNSPQRDAIEKEVFEACQELGTFNVGICRGGQFLNVMNGGRMWQDVDNHCRPHIATDIASGRTYWVSSTHHQMMRPTEEAIILMVAEEMTHAVAAEEQWITGSPRETKDIEAVFYPTTRSLCFQPHPEFSSMGDCLRAFMMYVRECYVHENGKAA
jgi:gamma-glutamyl-gamma-aminobutyrate hydrolase PuuD